MVKTNPDNGNLIIEVECATNAAAQWQASVNGLLALIENAGGETPGIYDTVQLLKALMPGFEQTCAMLNKKD